MSEGVIIIRPSFMKFCEDGCRAALFNHILYWIAKKAMDQSQEALQAGEITYYATTEELAEQMAGAWGVCKVRKAINEIIEMGIIGRGKNPKWGADRTKHFFFGKEQYTKLVELCKKHLICLAHIGLPKEMITLLSVFSQFVECPCTEQTINPSFANDKSIECPEHKQMINLSNANDRFIGAITKVTTKVSKTKVTERKNDEGQQKSNGAEKQETFHSSIPSKPSSQIIFTEEEETVLSHAKTLKLSYLGKNEKNKAHCARLVSEGITTLEQMKSLMHFCQQRPNLQGKDLNLGNLANDDNLNGWAQLQNAPASVTTERKAGHVYCSYDDPDYVDDSFYPAKRKGAS